MKRNPSRVRRGVLLLLVLGLLTMFGLVAVAFVVLTGQSMRSAMVLQRMEQYADPPEDVCHQVAMEAFCGSSSPMSPLRYHSLLEDMYGNASVVGTITQVRPLAAGQLIEFTYTLDNPATPLPDSIPDPTPHYRLGCVLTMTSGAARGQSTRIVGINPTAFPGIMPQMRAFADGGVPVAGDTFVINGTPFSGTGIGFDPTTGTFEGPNDAAANRPTDNHDSDLVHFYLRPNTVARSTRAARGRTPGWQEFAVYMNGPDGIPNTIDDIAANEDYDAVDLHNMLLAGQYRDKAGVLHTIPSMHRPALVNYWDQQLRQQTNVQGNWTNPQFADLFRKVMLRPLPADHPMFCANTNPMFNPLLDQTWDVDNDGDTLPDSIWIDLGLPVRSTPDGRLYKPLVALLCVDMDGRLNLNAHGSLAHASELGPDANNGNLDAPAWRRFAATTLGPYEFAQGGGNPWIFRGQGYGPAEISLLPLFRTAPNTDNYYYGLHQALLGGNPAWELQGRYGEMPSGSANAGRTGIDDLLSQNKEFENAGVHWAFLTGNLASLDAYGTPPDLHGMGAVALDISGNPFFHTPYEPSYEFEKRAITGDDPYELDLSRGRGGRGPRAIDSPFTPTELERMLRAYDRDATTLSDRILKLTSHPSIAGGTSLLMTPEHPAVPGQPMFDRRRAVTTESWDLPCPNLALPPAMTSRLPGKRAHHIVDVLAQAYLRTPGMAFETAIAQSTLHLSSRMLAGLKMNINRPFGNGRDDNGNGIVDEFGEVDPLELSLGPAGTTPVPFDHDNDGVPVYDPTKEPARVCFARQLYLLAMALTDPAAWMANPEPGETPEQTRARNLAQFAVNVVDFRDRDSIMTRFAYDPTPFDADGWTPPQNDPRFVVWGCERPELLITETLAFHDRRTEDTTEDTEGKVTTATEPEDRDENFDQRYVPEGSLFIEIFNPWGQRESRSADLNTAPNGGVDLKKTAPDGTPIWRLVILDPNDPANDGIDPDASGNPSNPVELPDLDSPKLTTQPEFERIVHFLDVPNASLEAGNGTPLEYSCKAALPPILPGEYAVIGPGSAQGGPKNKTYLGESNGTQDNNTRHFDMTPTPANMHAIQLARNSTPANPAYAPTAANVKPFVPIRIDSIPRVDGPSTRFSVSEPVDGYGLPAGITYDSAAKALTPVSDIPLDFGNKALGEKELENGTTDMPHRIVYLQRLADPTRNFDGVTGTGTNPYRTIDAMTIDLTVFNGTENSPRDPQIDERPYTFASRQRGHRAPGQVVSDATGPVNDLWKQQGWERPEMSPQATAVPPANPVHEFTEPLSHSLGYLNTPFGPPRPAAPNSPHLGGPQQPFPWLTWLNRPFASHMELMLVPAHRSSKLLARSMENPYKYFFQLGFTTRAGGAGTYNPAKPDEVVFPQLANFFHSATITQVGGQPVARPGTELHRLLEFVHVPSRFVGTEDQLNPAVFQAGAADAGQHRFHPPYHFLSRYREPGRINLNTIFSRDVFDGLMFFGLPISSESHWQEFFSSRRSTDYGDPSNEPVAWFEPGHPSQFCRPFRSFGGAYMATEYASQWSYPGPEINATLLRHATTAESDPGSSAWKNRPLFDASKYQNTVSNRPEQNPYFHYRSMTRLGNLTTTRSNVYALWVTVGYFEVTPAPGAQNDRIDRTIYPDGYQLGAELGSDTGDAKRHRAFYLFDRSIPVGFQRGKELNVDKAILVRRYIE